MLLLSFILSSKVAESIDEATCQQLTSAQQIQLLRQTASSDRKSDRPIYLAASFPSDVFDNGMPLPTIPASSSLNHSIDAGCLTMNFTLLKVQLFGHYGREH